MIICESHFLEVLLKNIETPNLDIFPGRKPRGFFI